MRVFIKLIEYCVIAMMAIITATVMGEVFLRGVFGVSLVVTDELSRYLMIWTAMLAMALLAGDDGHIRITLISDMVPPAVARAMTIVADILVIIFLIALIVTSLRHLPAMSGQRTVTLGISMAWVYAAMPAGGVLAVILILTRNVTRLRTDRTDNASNVETL